MKLIWRIISRVVLVMLVIIPLWAFFFYKTIITEVNDETDDSLELYAEQRIREYLTDTTTIKTYYDNGTNNSYTIEKLPPEADYDYHNYSNVNIYIPARQDTEPARVLRTTFVDAAGDRCLITVMTPTLETEDLIRAIVYWITVLFLGLLVVIIISVSWVVIHSVRPLHILIQWINSYRLGKKIAPLNNHTNITEFQKLNDVSLRLVKRSEQLFDQQRQFIGNASHEMQTPLAVCQNRLELLCDTQLSEAQLAEIIKTRTTLDYISKLNKSLLFLTKIENGQFIEQTTIDITEIVDKSIENYSEIYAYKNVAPTVELKCDSLKVNMNQTLATSLISNLIRNAYIHNKENGILKITITDHTLTIANQGLTKSLDKAHIFERFWQNTRRNDSTGLGLPISKAICNHYHFGISYYYINTMHTFTINFSTK